MKKKPVWHNSLQLRLEKTIRELLDFNYAMQEWSCDVKKHNRVLTRAQKQVGWKPPKTPNKFK